MTVCPETCWLNGALTLRYGLLVGMQQLDAIGLT
jgi:hypothetical protein